MTKLSISNAWDESKAIIARDGKLFVTIALALLLLPGVVSDLVTPAAPKGQPFPEPGPWMAVMFVAVIISAAAQLALISLAVGSRMTVGQAIGHGAKRVPSYIAASLIWVLPFAIVFAALWPMIQPPEPSGGAALGALVLIPVFLFIYVRLLMASAVASNEGAGPIAILTRSWNMTKGNWWRLFGFLLLFGITWFILVIAVSAVAGLVATALLGGMGEMSVGALLVSLLTRVVSTCVWVLFAVMLARIYVQLSGAASGASVPRSGT
jgi:hypothetical protein